MGRSTYPVVEIFGPTLQGEGVLIGRQTHFVRLGGCDFRCHWCDTMYAVDPALVKLNSVPMTSEEIGDELLGRCRLHDTREPEPCRGHGPWVTISGGNPLIFDLRPLLHTLVKDLEVRVAIETQGTICSTGADALRANVSLLIVSPKPPSSGMPFDAQACARILQYMPQDQRIVKVVVFNSDDYEFAVQLRELFPTDEFFLSLGTPRSYAELPIHQIRHQLLEGAQKLADQVLADPRMPRVGVLPQLHTLLWGSKRGV